jgi:RNase adapter protein RapZ
MMPPLESDIEVGAPRSEARVLVITGLSGAGRSTASNTLEDLGWFVIDNLPPSLIGPVFELASAPGSSVTQLGLVIDVRGREFFGALEGAIADLRTAGVDVRVVFLEADDDVLVTRFEETRRRHPADPGGGLLAGIAAERVKLAALREQADLIVDTSRTNVHGLRDRIIGLIAGSDDAPLQVNVVSFGFKRGTPREADLLLDVRFLPNPHWEDDLRPLDGRDAAVREFVFGQTATQPFLDSVERMLDIAVPGYVAEGKRYLTIAVGCTGGKHRSVAVAEQLARYLDANDEITVQLVHRDLGAE